MLDNDRNFSILEAVSLAVSIIAVAMSALNVLNALMMATQERTREIGIFAAIGWSRSRIMMSIVIEGLVMCVIGCVLGVLLSFLAAPRFRDTGHRSTLSRSGRARADRAGLLAAFALCILRGAVPAWRAVRMVPAEALRRM